MFSATAVVVPFSMVTQSVGWLVAGAVQPVWKLTIDGLVEFPTMLNMAVNRFPVVGAVLRKPDAVRAR